MRYRYLDDFRRGISVFAIFSYGIAILGTPQCPPPLVPTADALPTAHTWWVKYRIFRVSPLPTPPPPAVSVVFFL